MGCEIMNDWPRTLSSHTHTRLSFFDRTTAETGLGLEKEKAGIFLFFFTPFAQISTQT